MFHRHNDETATDYAIAVPRVATVRLLEGDEELQAAVERAKAFERRGMDQGQQRVMNYERYLRERPEDLANVVHIDSTRGAELMAELGLDEIPTTGGGDRSDATSASAPDDEIHHCKHDYE
jgi:hypothetical protein